MQSGRFYPVKYFFLTPPPTPCIILWLTGGGCLGGERFSESAREGRAFVRYWLPWRREIL